MKIRNCVDDNICGVTTNKPSEVLSCDGVGFDFLGAGILSLEDGAEDDDRSLLEIFLQSKITQWLFWLIILALIIAILYTLWKRSA